MDHQRPEVPWLRTRLTSRRRRSHGTQSGAPTSAAQQPGRAHPARRLGQLTGMAVHFGPTQHSKGGLFGNAVLTRLPIQDVEIHPLSSAENTPERVTYPRGAIAITVQSLI